MKFLLSVLLVAALSLVSAQAGDSFVVPELKNGALKQTPGVSCDAQSNEEVCNAISFCGWCDGKCHHGAVSPCAAAHAAPGTKKPGFITGSPGMVTAGLASDGLDGHVVVEADAVASLPASTSEEKVPSEATPEEGSEEDATHFHTKDEMAAHDAKALVAEAEERDESSQEEQGNDLSTRADLAALEHRLKKIEARVAEKHGHHASQEEEEEKKGDALDEVKRHVQARIEEKEDKAEAAASETPIEALRRKVTALEERFNKHHTATNPKQTKAEEAEEKEKEEAKEEEKKVREEEKEEQASASEADAEDLAKAEAGTAEPKEVEHGITDAKLRENIRHALAGESVEKWSDSIDPINYTDEDVDSTQEDGDDANSAEGSNAASEDAKKDAEEKKGSVASDAATVKRIIEEAKAGVPERVIEEEVEAEKKGEKKADESSEQVMKEDEGKEEKASKVEELEKRMVALEKQMAAMHSSQDKATTPNHKKKGTSREQRKVRAFFKKIVAHKK